MGDQLIVQIETTNHGSAVGAGPDRRRAKGLPQDLADEGLPIQAQAGELPVGVAVGDLPPGGVGLADEPTEGIVSVGSCERATTRGLRLLDDAAPLVIGPGSAATRVSHLGTMPDAVISARRAVVLIAHRNAAAVVRLGDAVEGIVGIGNALAIAPSAGLATGVRPLFSVDFQVHRAMSANSRTKGSHAYAGRQTLKYAKLSKIPSNSVAI